MLDKEAEQGLLEIFGERVAFHETERTLYSSDISRLPRLVRKQIQPVPDAVVQPASTEELRRLMDLAMKFGLPLVPRGSGTAGYGGAVPVRGGIVVDFYRLRRVLEIDTEEKTVTVESGTVWQDLEKELRGRGLSLRTYPSSAISATVGGWLANGGGIGIGSFEYGHLRDNVVEAELVTPQGLHNITGNDLSLVDGMAGTTGLLSRVKLKAREADEDIPVLAAFNDLDALLGAFEEFGRCQLPLWHVGYRDPLHVRLNRDAVRKQTGRAFHHGGNEEPGLPEEKLLALFVYPEKRRGQAADGVLDIIEVSGGEVLGEEAARHEWEERFYPMRLKALGPSIISSEAIILTERLPELVKNIKRIIKGVAFEGILINHGEESAFLTYALEDESRRGYALAFPASLVPIEEAGKLGGRAYAAGMLLTDQAPKIFGEEVLRHNLGFKKQADSPGILNPGKVFPIALLKDHALGRLNRLASIARKGGGALRAMDKIYGGKPGGNILRSKTAMDGLPFAGEIAWDTYACVGCGYCRSECPQFSAIGWESASPRGKFSFIREYLQGNTTIDKRMSEMLFACTTCHQCDELCQVKSRIEEDWTWVAKPALLKEGFRPPAVFQRQARNIMLGHNPSGASQETRSDWMTSELKYNEEGEIGYFAGCAVSFTYLLRNVPINAFRVLNRAGIEPAYLGSEEWCCGGAVFNVGCIDELEEIVRHNLREVKRRGIKTLITSCSSCWYNLGVLYQTLARHFGLAYDIEMKHITEFVSGLIERGAVRCELPVELRVTYHDPCHIGRGGSIFDPPRKILASIPGLELREMPRNREHSACCGKHIARYPRLGSIINNSRTSEAAQTGAEAVVCSCTTCENNFRQGIAETGVSLEVLDIIDLVAESMGLPRLSVSKMSRLLHHKGKVNAGG